MPTQTRPQQEKGTLATDPGRRRSMRVLLSVPIVVSGKDADNKGFTEEARTLVVNAHGALIALADRKSTRLNSSHPSISYAVFCLKKKKNNHDRDQKLTCRCIRD